MKPSLIRPSRNPRWNKRRRPSRNLRPPLPKTRKRPKSRPSSPRAVPARANCVAVPNSDAQTGLPSFRLRAPLRGEFRTRGWCSKIQKRPCPAEPASLRLGSLALTARTDEIIESALRRATTRQSGRPAVGDGVPGGMRGGYLPPSPGNTGSNLELLSDPKGIDFRPYLIQILASVRRNWHAVIPESARLGLNRGRVSLQFSVARDGSVPKLVIAASSGVPALDRAAVAGISASNPFPPLPGDFNGQTVRLQFKFAYNMK